MGLNTFTYNHLTVDCGQNRFLVNRYGLSWNEVTAENLLLVNSEGIILEGEGPVMQAAFVIHAMVHSEKKEMAKVVFHTHQCAATALTACVQTKYSHLTEELSCLPMVTQSCLDFAGRTMYDPVYTEGAGLKGKRERQHPPSGPRFPPYLQSARGNTERNAIQTQSSRQT